MLLRVALPLSDNAVDFCDRLISKCSIQTKKAEIVSLPSLVSNNDQVSLPSFNASKYLNGWELYDPLEEYGRMGILPDSPELTLKSFAANWRFSSANASYQLCPTYPKTIIVPRKISDNVLFHAAKFRSKSRFPALSYLHSINGATITRSSQPLVGFQRKRSIQDEKLIEAIFSSHIPMNDISGSEGEDAQSSKHRNTAASTSSSFAAFWNKTVSKSFSSLSFSISGAPPSRFDEDNTSMDTAVKAKLKKHLILDARPTANAMANYATGAGSESMENYKSCKKLFLGIDNIHVMRESLSKLYELMPLTSSVSVTAIESTGWLKHLQSILEATSVMVKAVHVDNLHVLVHCSDGWDRTAQLTSLAQLCLEPYYRTWKGFAVLIEKEWIAFGHRFQDRCGLLHYSSKKEGMHPNPNVVTSPLISSSATTATNSSSGSNNNNMSFSHHGALKKRHPREVGPIFHQFLECVYHLYQLYPLEFEFNETFLLEVYGAVHSGQFGTFLGNCEADLSVIVPETAPLPSISLSEGQSQEFVQPIHSSRPSSTNNHVYQRPTTYTGSGLKDTTLSLWTWIDYLWSLDIFKNPHYIPPSERMRSQSALGRHASLKEVDLQVSDSSSNMNVMRSHHQKYFSVAVDPNSYGHKMAAGEVLIPLPPGHSVKLWKGLYARWNKPGQSDQGYLLMEYLPISSALADAVSHRTFVVASPSASSVGPSSPNIPVNTPVQPIPAAVSSCPLLSSRSNSTSTSLELYPVPISSSRMTEASAPFLSSLPEDLLSSPALSQCHSMTETSSTFSL